MAWEDPKLHGTANFSREEAHAMMRGINKQLLDKQVKEESEAQEVLGQKPITEPKKAGFGSY